MGKYCRSKKYIEVDIPKGKKISFSKNNKRRGDDTVYVYYSDSFKYNPNTKKTNTHKLCIGRINNDTGRLIPNENYFKFFEDETVSSNNKEYLKVLDYGNIYIINKIASILHIDEYLTKALDSDMKDISLDLVNHLLLNTKGVIKDINNFYIRNYLNYKKYMDDSRISSFFDNIEERDIIEFFKLWKDNNMNNEYVAVDVTSISSYSDSNRFSYGYNRDNEELPQVNNILIYGVETKLPLYYEEYDGSINDKTGFIKVLEHIIALGYSKKNMTFLMDRGFPTNKNLKEIEEIKEIKYISCIDVHQVNIAKVIRKLGNISLDISTIVIDNNNNKFYAKEVECPGHDNRRYIFFYSSQRRDNDVIAFNNKIQKVIYKLINGEEIGTKEKGLLALLNITKDDNERIIKVEKNDKLINEYALSFGYFGFITNILDLTPTICINAYGLRIYVEVEYDEQKVDLGGKRKRTHNDNPNTNTNRGKTFIMFIAMIIRSYIRRKIKEYNELYKGFNTSMLNQYSSLKGLSPRDLIDDLSLIQITNIFGNTELFHLINKKQKTELHVFNVSDKEIYEKAKSEILD